MDIHQGVVLSDVLLVKKTSLARKRYTVGGLPSFAATANLSQTAPYCSAAGGLNHRRTEKWPQTFGYTVISKFKLVLLLSRSHPMLLTHALALSDNYFSCKKKSLRVFALGENWTCTIDFRRHEDDLCQICAMHTKILTTIASIPSNHIFHHISSATHESPSFPL